MKKNNIFFLFFNFYTTNKTTTENRKKRNILCYLLFFAGVTILLSLTVFLNLVAETLPQVSDAIPLLGSDCI